MVFGINTTSGISKLLYITIRRVKFETILNSTSCENALILSRILSTSFPRKRMEIGVENFYVDIGA